MSGVGLVGDQGEVARVGVDAPGALQYAPELLERDLGVGQLAHTPVLSRELTDELDRRLSVLLVDRAGGDAHVGDHVGELVELFRADRLIGVEIRQLVLAVGRDRHHGHADRLDPERGVTLAAGQHASEAVDQVVVGLVPALGCDAARHEVVGAGGERHAPLAILVRRMALVEVLVDHALRDRVEVFGVEDLRPDDRPFGAGHGSERAADADDAMDLVHCCPVEGNDRSLRP